MLPVCSNNKAEARGHGAVQSKQAQTGVISDKLGDTRHSNTERGRVAVAGLRLLCQKMCTENGESMMFPRCLKNIVIASRKLFMPGLPRYGGALPLCSAFTVKGLARCNPCRCNRDKLPTANLSVQIFFAGLREQQHILIMAARTLRIGM